MIFFIFYISLFVVFRDIHSTNPNENHDPVIDVSHIHKNVYLPPVKNNPLTSKFGISYRENISDSRMFVFKFAETFDKVDSNLI